jgi:hypothetical protein
VKIIEHKARGIKSGETVLDRGTWFIIKEARVSVEPDRIASSTQTASGTESIIQMNTWE